MHFNAAGSPLRPGNTPRADVETSPRGRIEAIRTTDRKTA